MIRLFHNPFDPEWREADARERERRVSLGWLGRLREDATFSLSLALYIGAWCSIFLLPWLVGAWTIACWFLEDSP